MISFLWWVLLLVSIFVSPPMMHSRGSGFFDFSYTTLTLGNLLVAILFFSTPSKAMEWGSLVVAFFLLVDMIIILAVPRVRVEEGWVGIASVVWATIMALYNVLTDRVVAWGKREEEERLTGRKETRRSLREWCAVLTELVIMVVLILITILLTATLILRSRDAGLAPPGKRYYVDGDKYQLHLACIGNVTYNSEGKRNPTILLEAGENPVEDTFDDWIYNAYNNGTIDRYCYYDRPGLGWSDNAPSPHSAGMTSDALSEALARAGEQSPWILVSAGIGGIYSRIFSSRHVKQISGIMLIDALHEDLLYKVARPGRGFALWARGIISPLGYDRLFGAIAKGRTPEDRVYGRSAYQGGKYIKAKLQENLVANSLTKNEVSQARNIQSEKTPLVVVSSGINVRKDDEWERKQRDLTKITENLLSWDVVNGAPHEVWKTYEGRQILEKRLGELVKG
jgi:pimeloyl-ACP methyl ester carboxylesterase